MTAAVTRKLTSLAASIEALPESAQADVLAEIESRIELLENSTLTDEQRDIVRQRLATPRDYADRADVISLLRRFNPTL